MTHRENAAVIYVGRKIRVVIVDYLRAVSALLNMSRHSESLVPHLQLYNIVIVFSTFQGLKT